MTRLDLQHVEYQCSVDLVELQSPADEPKTQLLQFKELQKLLELAEPVKVIETFL